MQAACFCSTVMATEQVALRGLPLGASPEESEELLQQTEVAGAAGLQ